MAAYSGLPMGALEEQLCSQRCTEMCTDEVCAASCRSEFCGVKSSNSLLYILVATLCAVGLLGVAYTTLFGREAKSGRRKFQPRPQQGSYLSL